MQEAHWAQAQKTHSRRSYDPSLIPGLLQTADYARSVLTRYSAIHTAPKDVEAAVQARMGRQDILTDQGRSFHFLVWEGALRARPCPPAVLSAQLDRIVGRLGPGNVRVGVVPFEADMKRSRRGRVLRARRQPRDHRDMARRDVVGRSGGRCTACPSMGGPGKERSLRGRGTSCCHAGQAVPEPARISANTALPAIPALPSVLAHRARREGRDSEPSQYEQHQAKRDDAASFSGQRKDVRPRDHRAERSTQSAACQHRRAPVHLPAM